jgi:hypothetical protein
VNNREKAATVRRIILMLFCIAGTIFFKGFWRAASALLLILSLGSLAIDFLLRSIKVQYFGEEMLKGRRYHGYWARGNPYLVTTAKDVADIPIHHMANTLRGEERPGLEAGIYIDTYQHKRYGNCYVIVDARKALEISVPKEEQMADLVLRTATFLAREARERKHS